MATAWHVHVLSSFRSNWRGYTARGGGPKHVPLGSTSGDYFLRSTDFFIVSDPDDGGTTVAN